MHRLSLLPAALLLLGGCGLSDAPPDDAVEVETVARSSDGEEAEGTASPSAMQGSRPATMSAATGNLSCRRLARDRSHRPRRVAELLGREFYTTGGWFSYTSAYTLGRSENRWTWGTREVAADARLTLTVEDLRSRLGERFAGATVHETEIEEEGELRFTLEVPEVDGEPPMDVTVGVPLGEDRERGAWAKITCWDSVPLTLAGLLEVGVVELPTELVRVLPPATPIVGVSDLAGLTIRFSRLSQESLQGAIMEAGGVLDDGTNGANGWFRLGDGRIRLMEDGYLIP